MLQRVGGAFGASGVLVSAVLAFGAPAVAKAPSPGPSTSASANPNLGPAIAGTAMCTISDPQITDVSGLVVTADGYAVINDSKAERARAKIFFLDEQCRPTRSVSYPSNAFDPEDLAVAKDGTLWVADVGDNTTLTGSSANRRSSIALWSLAPGGNSPVIHRLAYPDGRARDAEALIMDEDGRPIIITKDPVGEIYALTGPLPANNANPEPLTRVGTFRPQTTGTTNPYGIVGTAVVTGAALSPDGKRAVVRTMSDAYEFTVVDGDVVAAITTGTPRITPLPSEPQGEAIAFTLDGRYYVTVSDQPKATPILRYSPYQPPAPPSAAPVVQPPAPKAEDRSFMDSLSLRDITRIVIGIGLFGVLLVVIGVAAVVLSRRRRRAQLAAELAAAPADPAETGTAPAPADAQPAAATASTAPAARAALTEPPAGAASTEPEAGAADAGPTEPEATGQDEADPAAATPVADTSADSVEIPAAARGDQDAPKLAVPPTQATAADEPETVAATSAATPRKRTTGAAKKTGTPRKRPPRKGGNG
ncbi:hypothetical protein AB0M46_32940 [Dactylosporangium sp. NPDC051485]|uniref:hypothetical protein n=1 Tax=Dactylosporangium sp. NPDC051485 TaxID=3154846 RepID=UPI003428B2CF